MKLEEFMKYLFLVLFILSSNVLRASDEIRVETSAFDQKGNELKVVITANKRVSPHNPEVFVLTKLRGTLNKKQYSLNLSPNGWCRILGFNYHSWVQMRGRVNEALDVDGSLKISLKDKGELFAINQLYCTNNSKYDY